MSRIGPLTFETELSAISTNRKERHEALVGLFGQFLFWLRNWSSNSSRTLVESEEARGKLGTVPRSYYEGVAQMTKEQREVAMLLVDDTLNGFIQRLVWCLGDEGTDARLGRRHAYRWKVQMEIVDVETGEVIEEESINRGGKFFGDYFGRWLNLYRDRVG